jgi:hypothetical protein
MKQGNAAYHEQGTPQGGVISPILSNIHLREVLDGWFVYEVQPRMKGRGSFTFLGFTRCWMKSKKGSRDARPTGND